MANAQRKDGTSFKHFFSAFWLQKSAKRGYSRERKNFVIYKWTNKKVRKSAHSSFSNANKKYLFSGQKFLSAFCAFRIVESSTLQFIGWLFVRIYGFHFIYLFPWDFARLPFHSMCDLHDAHDAHIKTNREIINLSHVLDRWRFSTEI